MISFNGMQGFYAAWMPHASRTSGFYFSFIHVARYAPSWKTNTYGTIAANSSQANLYNLPFVNVYVCKSSNIF